MADECFDLDITMVAPEFVFAEVSSAFRRRVYRELLTPAEGMLAVGLLMQAPITRYDVRDIYTDAWRIAEVYRLPTLYDAYYVALAELLGCTLWTADERLQSSVEGLPYVRHIRNFAPGALEG